MRIATALSTAVILAISAAAGAAITTWEAWWVDAAPLDTDLSGWQFDWDTNTWTVWEEYTAPHLATARAACHVVADGEPIIHVSKTVHNNSTFVWTDYHVVVAGADVGYVPGSATSDVFQTIEETGNVIDFYAPDEVPICTEVTIEFDIQIPTGDFTFDISQTPTPEPGALALLTIGALGLLRRRRR